MIRALWVLLWLGIAATGATGATAEIAAPILPQDYQARLGIGMDVDWAKTPKGMDYYTAQTPRDFKARGFSHVRIRIRNDATPEMLAHIERVVNDSLAAGLLPVVAYQAAPFKRDPSPETMAAFVNWWRRVAEALQDMPPEVSFDLIIEVTEALNKQPAQLNTAYAAAVSAIRDTNPGRILMISPVVRSAPENLPLLEIPPRSDGYLMAEFHFYASGPDKTNPKKLWTTGTPAERALIAAKIAAALDWQEKTGIPVWVGAWMAGNYNKGNDYTIPEQATFARFVSCALQSARIPFAVNSDNFFRDRARGQWRPELEPVLDAILTPCP